MSTPSQTESLLIGRIREGDQRAWTDLIARYEGRLLAFAESRVGNRAAAEDVVQETFVGFVTSLPNYDRRRKLESYLFSIAAHKLTDHLRREGRRPTLSLAPEGAASSSGGWQPAANARAASSIVRSGERRGLERSALEAAMAAQIAHFKKRGQWEKLQCLELLLVRGRANKEAAEQLGISEQTVANYKFEFLAKLRTSVRKQQLPEEVFPELYEEG